MKRRIVWLLASCLVVAALLVTSCGGAEEEVVTPGEEVKEIPLPPMPIEVGVRVANELLAVTLTEIKICDSYDCYSPEQKKNITVAAEPGKLFLLGYFVVENTGTKIKQTGLNKIRLYDAEGSLCGPTNLQYLGEDRLLADHYLPVGETMDGWAVFSFPEEAYDLTLKYNTAAVTFPPRERTVEWVIRPSE